MFILHKKFGNQIVKNEVALIEIGATACMLVKGQLCRLGQLATAERVVAIATANPGSAVDIPVLGSSFNVGSNPTGNLEAQIRVTYIPDLGEI